jgi:hypothetical protein
MCTSSDRPSAVPCRAYQGHPALWEEASRLRSSSDRRRDAGEGQRMDWTSVRRWRWRWRWRCGRLDPPVTVPYLVRWLAACRFTFFNFTREWISSIQPKEKQFVDIHPVASHNVGQFANNLTWSLCGKRVIRLSCFPSNLRLLNFRCSVSSSFHAQPKGNKRCRLQKICCRINTECDGTRPFLPSYSP